MRLRDFWPSSIALFTAIAAVWLIKRFFLYHQLSATIEGIFALEALAVVTLLGSFIIGEVLRIYGRIQGQSPESPDAVGLRTRDVVNVMATLAASVAIFIVARYFFR